MHTAHLQWLGEHDALSAVLYSVKSLTGQLVKQRRESDFRATRAMLVYLGDYPERVHHPREETELFDRLRGRDAQLDQTLDELHSQHGVSLEAVMRIEHQLNRAEFGSPEELIRYAQDIERFVAHYHAHMQTEERNVFPAAERLLSETDWIEIATELARERDPLQGTQRDADFDQLLSTITRITPAPLGLGDP